MELQFLHRHTEALLYQPFRSLCEHAQTAAPHAQRERGKVIGVGVLIYIYMFVDKKNLNRTLAIDSPFQTYAVGLLVEFID